MRIVRFESQLADESGASDSPPGRRLATELRDQLSSNGVECSAVDLHSEFGWAWVQKSEGTSFYVLITQADGTHGRWLLSIEPTSVLTFPGVRKHRVRRGVTAVALQLINPRSTWTRVDGRQLELRDRTRAIERASAAESAGAVAMA